jgi:hypothetical protein
VGTETSAVMTLRARGPYQPYQTPARRVGRARRREANRHSDDRKDKRK